MALQLFGTDATNTLSAAVFKSSLAIADVALLANAIKDDINPAHPVVPGAFSRVGLLFIPNRGVLRCFPGDVVAIGSTGFPILVGYNALDDWTLV